MRFEATTSKRMIIKVYFLGFGGLSGKDAPSCKPGLVPYGTDCVSPGFLGPAVHFDAFQACSNGGDVLLTPHSVVQNEIFKSFMIDQVCYNIHFVHTNLLTVNCL